MGRISQYTQKMKNGSVYVFECENVNDPEKKQTRKKNRKLIGRLDEDGNIVPTRKKAPKGKNTQEQETQKDPQKDAAISRLEDLVEKQKQEIESLRSELNAEKARNKKLRTVMMKMASKLSEEALAEE